MRLPTRVDAATPGNDSTNAIADVSKGIPMPNGNVFKTGAQLYQRCAYSSDEGVKTNFDQRS